MISLNMIYCRLISLLMMNWYVDALIYIELNFFVVVWLGLDFVGMPLSFCDVRNLNNELS